MSSNRISREAVNIRIASLISQRGTCERLQVGAVITHDKRIVSTGYNGPARDEEHCNANCCDISKPCIRAVHAEKNAILNLPKFPSHYSGNLVIYCTHQPCLNCAELLVGVVKRVYFMSEYRDKSGIKLLLENGIKVIKINLNGTEIPYQI